MKKIIPITDLENLIDWFFELTLIKGFSDKDALDYMSLRTPEENLKQLKQKLQIRIKKERK